MAAPTAPQTAPATILVVDDDRGLLRLVEKSLHREGYSVVSLASGREAIDWLGRNTADLLLLDLKLQDIEGREFINHLDSIGRRTPFVIITGQGDERVAVDMMKRGALDYLVKDVQFQAFVPTVVRHALEQVERERKLRAAEAALRANEALMAQAQAIAHFGSFEWAAPFTGAARWSDEMFRIHGLDPSAGPALLADYVERHVHTEDREGVRQRLDDIFRQAGPWSIEYRIVRPDGTVRHVQGDGEPVKDASGKVTKLVGTLTDITERRVLEQEILGISEREQQRISRDLHDSLGQQLTGIELMSQVLEQQLSQKSKAAAKHAGEIARLVRQAISQTRDLARGLSPVMHEAEGLMSALKDLAAGTEKLSGVKCEFQCDSPVLVPDNSAATHLYRIAQEAVSNALKHARPSRIQVSLSETDSRLVLSVRNDGAAFREPQDGHRGLGLRIMQFRAGIIGGSFAIQKGPRGLTTVVCTVHKHSNS